MRHKVIFSRITCQLSGKMLNVSDLPRKNMSGFYVNKNHTKLLDLPLEYNCICTKKNHNSTIRKARSEASSNGIGRISSVVIPQVY